MRLPYIMGWLIIEVVSLLVFFLYDLTLLPWVHMSIILLVVLLVCGFVDYSKISRKHKLLVDNHLDMVEPSNYIEETFMDIIEAERDNARIAKDKASSDYNDMLEYYTVWAHQVKTPLAGLSLTVQNIDDDVLRQTLQSELVRTEEYVDMVMNYLRLQSNDSDYVFVPVEINDVVRQEARRMRTLFMSKKIGLSFDPEVSEGVKAVTDRRWLEFALGQVLANAVKYSNSGVVSISVLPEYIEVKDQGIGISEEDLPRIFEKGYTGYNGRSDKKSTGIGLYLVKKAMVSIGGDIVITSKMGEGTCVKLVYKK